MCFNYFDRPGFRQLPFLLLAACALFGCSGGLRVPDSKSLKGAQEFFWDVFFEPSKRVSTELLLASKSGNIQLVDELLDSEADRTGGDDLIYLSIETKDEKGWTPLMWAVHNNHLSTVDALIRAGANADARGYDGSTPLALAVRNNHREIFERVLTECEAVDVPNNEGVTPLMLAVAANNLNFAEKLMSEDANSEIRDSRGNSAFSIALAASNYGAVEVLLKGDTWKRIGIGTRSSYYLDPLSIRVDSEGTVSVWIKKIEETKVQPTKRGSDPKGESKPSRSETFTRFGYLSVQCMEQRFRELRSAKVSDDASVTERSSRGEWISALPETRAAEIIHSVCESVPLFTARKVSMAPCTGNQADG